MGTRVVKRARSSRDTPYRAARHHPCLRSSAGQSAGFRNRGPQVQVLPETQRLPVSHSGGITEGMRNPKAIGENSEAQVLAALLRAEEVVLLPFGDSQRYDFVLDRRGVFWRLQVKTGRLRQGAVRFATASSGSTTDHRTRQTYKGAADFFAVYCPETDKVYLVPVEECGGCEHALRIEPARNGQRRGTRLAAEYEYPMGT